MITYKLLNNKRAIILTRSATVVQGNIEFNFENAPLGSTAIFSNSKEKYYRELVDGKCSVPTTYFDGIIEITVSLFKKSPIERWKCENLKCTKISDDKAVVAPDDADLPEEFAKLRLEVDELRETNENLKVKIEALRKNFEEIKQGYNLV